MSKWGLMYKGVEPLFPEEYNRIVDALDELDRRIPAQIQGGQIKLIGDGSTTIFNIAHTLGRKPDTCFVGKATYGIPDIDSWDADPYNIIVRFKAAPASGQEFYLWWIAIVF